MNKINKIIIISLIFFFIITYLVIAQNTFIISFDNSINNFFLNHQSPSVSNLMHSITKIGNLYESLIIFAIFGLFLIVKNRKYFCTFAIATSLGALFPWAIKLLVERERPSLILEQNYSFPSSHATLAIVFLLSSAFLLLPLMKKGFSKTIFSISTSVIFPLVAFSRIYLSVHWTMDVIAGLILGIICYFLSEIICCHKKENVL